MQKCCIKNKYVFASNGTKKDHYFFGGRVTFCFALTWVFYPKNGVVDEGWLFKIFLRTFISRRPLRRQSKKGGNIK